MPNILSKRLPTSEISKFSKTNGIRNKSKSSEISKISKTNGMCEINEINVIRK